jgi:hypothetical protein
MKVYAHLWLYLAQFTLKREMFYTKFVEKLKTHTLCSVMFFRKSYCYEITQRNTAELGKPQLTVQYIACILLAE